MNNFRGGLSGISAKKESLVTKRSLGRQGMGLRCGMGTAASYTGLFNELDLLLDSPGHSLNRCSADTCPTGVYETSA